LVSRTDKGVIFSIIWLIVLFPRLGLVIPARYRQALPAKPVGVDDDLLDRMKAFSWLDLYTNSE